MKKFVAVLVFALLVSASGIRSAGAEDKEIRIGAIFAITGGAAWLGVPERDTAQMIVDSVNADGGINGVPVKLIIEDTQGDNTVARQAITRLITEENVCAVIGPSRSGTSMAVKEIAIEHEVPLISCAAAEAIISPVNPWIFKTPQKDSDAVRCIYQHMNKHGISKVALLTGSTGFGSAGRDQLRAIAPEYGIEIVSDQTYGPQDTDMTPQLIQIEETDAQAIINWSIVPAQSIVVQNAAQMGMEIPVYQSHGFGNIKYAEAAGKAAEKVIFPAGRLLIAESLREEHAQRAALLAYKQAYEKKFGEEVSTFGGHAYDSLHLVLNAIRAVGPDRAAIRDYIESTQAFLGTGGIFWFSPEDHNGLDMRAFEMMTVRDGKFVPVED